MIVSAPRNGKPPDPNIENYKGAATMSMLTLQALREQHVRPAGEYGDPAHSKRACPCCASLRPRSQDVARVRRAQRRRERQAFRNTAPDQF